MRHELGWLQTWVVMATNVFRARELIWQLFKRDFLVQYKKSFVGYAWVFLSPLLGILSWIFLQVSGMLKPGDVGIPYPAYLLVGTSMWGLFVGLYQAASETLSGGRDIIMQVKFPHEAMLFKQVAQQLANFTIALVLNIAVLLAFHVVPSWNALLLPLVALPLFFLATALGLLISMIGVVAMDISRLADVGLTLMMFVTPVIYTSSDKPPLVQFLNTWNPLTYLVCSCRDLIIYGRLYHPSAYFVTAVMAFVVFAISWRLFYVSEDQLVERMI